MGLPTAADITRWIRKAVIASAALVVTVTLLGAWLLHNRPSLENLGQSVPPLDELPADSVTVTWFGVSTLLFDDGETQVLIDGFFSRPSMADLVFDVPVSSHAARINYVMDEYQMRRLAAIIPSHSHYDHAMDIGALANRSSASILGSPSSAQIARGAGVSEDQIVVATEGESYEFGNFSVTLLRSRHAPIAWGGSTPFAGTIEQPLRQPAPASAWRAGESYSVVVEHPLGRTLVQSSAGFIEGALGGIRADVVMLGIFGLDGLGSEYTERYWRELVTSTGASRVFPIHFDDSTLPLGEARAYPRIIHDLGDTARLIDAFRQIWDTDTRIYWPELGRPSLLFGPEAPEA
jgi:L-ascorbate metabolism protein UlaG (beta-lactamase superfamily)